MSVLRRFLPKVVLVGLFLSVAIFLRVEQDAGAAADPLTPEERAFVAAHGPIRYAPDPQFPPFEFLDSSGVAMGITPDLLTVMGKKLGVEFRTVAYPTWSDVLEAVKRGKVDLSRNPHPDARARRFSALLQAVSVGALRSVRPSRWC